MDFNFMKNGLPSNGNQVSQTLSTTYEQGDTKAVLYLFSPRSIAKVQKRPTQYNFNLNFLEDMKDNITNVINVVDLNYRAASFMDNYASSLDAIKVDPKGFNMETDRLSDLWTFVLQVDNEQLSDDGMYNGPKLNNRFIYSGFCSDEPISQLDGLRVTVNPRCVLQITHETTMKLNKRFSPMGDKSLMQVNSDLDYIVPTTLQVLNSDVNNLLTPDRVQRASFDFSGSDGIPQQYVSNMHTSLGLNTGAVPVPSFLNNPKHHLSHIVGAIMQSVDEINIGNYSSEHMRNTAPGIWGTTRVLESSISNHLAAPVADNCIGIDARRAISISELQYKYGNITIVPVGADKLSLNDLADQSVISNANIASSILSTAIPPIINDSGLCEFSFFYQSYSNTPLVGQDNDQGRFEVLNYATWALEPVDVVKMRVKTALAHLKHQLFPVIKNIGGDFDLSCSCTSVGECDVILIFKDSPNSTQGLFESSLLLGGINSPMVGSLGNLQHNSNNYQSMIQCLDTELVPRLPNNPYSHNVKSIQSPNPIADLDFRPRESLVTDVFQAFGNHF